MVAKQVLTVKVHIDGVRTTLRAAAWIAALAIGGAIGRMGEGALDMALKLINGMGTAG